MENETLINNPENTPDKKKGVLRKIMKSIYLRRYIDLIKKE